MLGVGDSGYRQHQLILSPGRKSTLWVGGPNPQRRKTRTRQALERNGGSLVPTSRLVGVGKEKGLAGGT